MDSRNCRWLLPLGNLAAVDVVRGAGSVRYGPQNVGGIINFVTRAIRRPSRRRVGLHRHLQPRWQCKANPTAFIGGTNDNGLGGALLYSGVHGNGYRESNDNVDIDDLMLKGAYRISKTDELSAAFHYYEAHAGMPGASRRSNSRPTRSSPRARMTISRAAARTSRSSTRTTTTTASSKS
jgi:outer membrane receptor for Fe3+-dicitrate